MDLDTLAKKVADASVQRFASQNLKADEIGLTVLRLDASGHNERGDYRGDQEMYPASVVKLFYLAYLAHLLETQSVHDTPEIQRATHDMIVDSDNDATNWVLEVITGATSGPELGPENLKRWMAKRQAVNRWFRGLGYKQVNASQKTWYSGPYGRERQGYGPNWELRNSLTPNECARLMSDIMQDKLVSKAKCEWMRSLLHRQIPAESDKADDQSTDFTGKVLPKGWKLWSKAGWTNTVRHDVATVEAPDGKRFIVAVFTKNHSGTADIVTFAASELIRGLGYEPRQLP